MGGSRARLNKKIKKTVRRTRNRFDRRPVAHFMHIGKTAGTALRLILWDVRLTTRYRPVFHGHGARLARLDAIPVGEKFFFCVRDPIGRYTSGFLARQRQDQPRYYVPWTEEEERAFSHFESPEDLAVSLSAGGDIQRHAEHAMRSIQHVQSSYWDFFHDPEYFKSRRDDLLWIGRQESLDMASLAVALGVDQLTMPEDAVAAHRATGSKPELSDLARENLRQWYAKDYEFLDLCAELFPVTTS